MNQTTLYEYQMRLLYYRENPPINDHINNIGANIAYTIYQCNATKKSKKLTFEDFKIDYKRANMDETERVEDDLKKFQQSNPSLFKVN